MKVHVINGGDIGAVLAALLGDTIGAPKGVYPAKLVSYYPANQFGALAQDPAKPSHILISFDGEGDGERHAVVPLAEAQQLAEGILHDFPFPKEEGERFPKPKSADGASFHPAPNVAVREERIAEIGSAASDWARHILQDYRMPVEHYQNLIAWLEDFQVAAIRHHELKNPRSTDGDAAPKRASVEIEVQSRADYIRKLVQDGVAIANVLDSVDRHRERGEKMRELFRVFENIASMVVDSAFDKVAGLGEPAEGYIGVARGSDQKAETDGDFMRRLGTDPAKWASEFMARFPNFTEDQKGQRWDILMGWFANAITAGESKGISRGRQDAEEQAAGKLQDKLTRARLEGSREAYDSVRKGLIHTLDTHLRNADTRIMDLDKRLRA